MNYANLEEAFAFYNNPTPDEILEEPEMSQAIVESVATPVVVPQSLSQCSCCGDKSKFDINQAIIFLLLIIIFFKK
jgi:hypothetical protein